MTDTDSSTPTGSSPTAPMPAISHVSLGSNNFDKAVAFYDKTLATLEISRILQHPGAVAYGRQFPEFWVQTPIDGQPASVGNGTHYGFFATSKEQVNNFFKAAVDAGAKADGDPGAREEYGKPYYGCFLRDLDGHKIEAAYWDMAIAAEEGMAL